MKKKHSLIEIKHVKVLCIILFVIFAGSFYSCNNDKDDLISLEDMDDSQFDEENGLQEDESVTEAESSANVGSDEEDINYIYVHICGAVKNPDVYQVKESTRLIEVIQKAGGLTKEAAGDYMNQAAIVMDGEQVYIPTKEEAQELNIPTPLTNSEDTGDGKINLNTASKSELMTLTGIGEAKANSIIDFREKNGDFKKIEDIKKISGIKDSIYNKIYEYITVE